MDNNMLGAALAEMAGPAKDFSGKLGGPEGARWWEEFKRFLRKEPTWVHRLLELVSTVEVAGVTKFVAADHFVVGNAGITYLGDSFCNNFLGKVEENVQAVTLNVWKLRESAIDESIRAELGADCEEIALAHFWAVFKKRSADGSRDWFFAYIRGIDGNLWAVSARRSSGGWGVHAGSMTYPRRWAAGNQVISRDS